MRPKKWKISKNTTALGKDEEAPQSKEEANTGKDITRKDMNQPKVW